MRSIRRASSATRWPSAASARAVASPMPDEAPVMTATRRVVFSRLMCVSSWALNSFGLVSLLQRSPRSERPCQRGTERAPLDGTCATYSDAMDAVGELSQFLTSRRAKITPEQAGLPSYGRRRVPGLRREEVASLAGVSVEYYKRLERGNVSGASELVLEGLARALQLDDAERAHLFDLARAASPVTARRSRPIKQKIRPVVQRILDQISAPATVRNARLDYIGANAVGRALYAPVFESREQPANSARFTFLDPAAADFYPHWDRVATELVAHLRSEAGRNPYDRQLS